MSRRLTVLLVGLWSTCLSLRADYLSLTGNLLFDPDHDGTYNAILAAGRLGVGTLSPQGNLHVAGNLLLTDAGEAAGRVLVSDAVGLGAWGNMSSLLAPSPWSSASGNAYILAANVGMGTATPSTNLVVGGNLRIVDGRQAAGRLLLSDANGTGRWDEFSVAESGWGVWSGNAICERGKVGIGTSVPTEALHVASGNLGLPGGDFITRNAVTPTRLDVYNTWTTATDWERGVIDWTTTANTVRLGTEASGSGTGRDVLFEYGGTVVGGYRNTNWAGISSASPGTRSACMGIGATASGFGSVAVGWNATASATFSTSVAPFEPAPYSGRTSFFPGQSLANNCGRSGMQWLNAATTDATPTVLSVPNVGSPTHTACGLSSNSSLTVLGVVLALAQDHTQTASFQVQATWQNNANTVTLVSSSITQVSNNANAWSLAASADDVNDRWVLTATGAAATAIRWSGMLLVLETSY